MKKFLLTLMILAVASSGLATLMPSPVAAQWASGKVCAKYLGTGNVAATDPMYLENCPTIGGITDLSTKGLFVVPDNSQCINDADVNNADSANKFACNSSTKPFDTIALYAKTLITNTVNGYKTANNGKQPTPYDIVYAINNGSYLSQPDPTINWAAQDCTKLSGVTQYKCQGVQKCLKDVSSGNTTQCVNAWDNCMTGKTTDLTQAKTCATQIGTPQSTATGGPEKETCNVTGVGWIICPLATFIGKTVDAVYTLIEQFMVYDVKDPFGDNPLKLIWSNILGIANVAFIIAFFVVIFSQATSVGISNYGIKKILPRMIAAAILVNLSYYICIFAVDISNAVGAGIDGILMSALPNAKSVTSGVHWETVIVGALGLGTAIAFAPAIVAAAITFAVPALLAVITTLVVLVARYALITILIVISPLAFVAFILPNTESLFDKWRKTFITMLVFYPLVTLLFVGSKVAAYIILLQ
ncbi:MAG: hypothetical protein WAU02_00790 [Candidatus Saccharimonadales bacterium]